MSTLKATNFQHASAANPAIVLAADGSATANVSSINSGPLAGFRNAIINGNFDIWQRGTSFSNPVSSAYTADRWQVIWNGSGATRTISRELFTVGQTDVPDNPTYGFRWAKSVAGTSGTFNVLAQGIEGVRTFAGQQVTVSFYAKATATVTLPAVDFWQDFGTGGSPSAAVNTSILTNVALTTSWQKIMKTVTLPSVSGKTIGSDANDHLSLEWSLPLNTTFTVDIAQVQVERGPVSSTFERRPIGTELALCQRYFSKSYNTETSPGTATSDGSVLMAAHATTSFLGFGKISFPVSMRATPTVTGYNPSTGLTTDFMRNTNANTNHPGALIDQGSSGFSAYVANSSISAGVAVRFHYTASIEL